MEACANPSELPEDFGKRAALLLLDEVRAKRAVVATLPMTDFATMQLGCEAWSVRYYESVVAVAVHGAVSGRRLAPAHRQDFAGNLLCRVALCELAVNSLSRRVQYTIQYLRHLKDFFGVTFKVDADVASDTIVMTCLGVGFENLSRPMK